jgi:arylsulfatase
MWPSVGNKPGWSARLVEPEPIYEARNGATPQVVATLNVDNRRTMEAEITRRAVDFIKRNASAGKPIFAYVPFSLVHMPTLPNPEFAGRTGNGDWADCLAEMDYRTGQFLDAIKEAGVEDDTLVIFTSDNGPEATNPWEGDSGPWRGTYFTAMEGSLRAPFIIRWPGKVPAARVSNEIVHIVDLFTTIAHVGGAEVRSEGPSDRWRGSARLFLRQAGGLQPRRLSRLRRRPALGREMAELKSARGLAGQYVRRHRNCLCQGSSICLPTERRSAMLLLTTRGSLTRR